MIGSRRPKLTNVPEFSDVSEKLKSLEREVRELRQANEILRKAPCKGKRGLFCDALYKDRRARSPPEIKKVLTMISFIEQHRGTHGKTQRVGPICRLLPIAPSTFHQHMACRRDPQRMSVRSRRDCVLKPEITRVFEENFGLYGVRKVWRQMQREGFHVARYTVQRLMRVMGLQGVIRGKRVRTTVPNSRHRVLQIMCPIHSRGQFKVSAPNRDLYKLWGSLTSPMS